MSDHEKLMKMMKAKYIFDEFPQRYIHPEIGDVIYLKQINTLIKCEPESNSDDVCEHCYFDNNDDISCSEISCNNGIFKEYHD